MDWHDIKNNDLICFRFALTHQIIDITLDMIFIVRSMYAWVWQMVFLLRESGAGP